MKMVKSLLLGSAAGVVAMAGAQAADLPVKAKPVQYVKICSLYGAGFYYIPGTDMCLKMGGWVRQYTLWNANGSATNGPLIDNINTRATNNFQWRSRGYITADARNQTEYGTVRSYIDVGFSVDYVSTGPSSAGFNTNRAFIQWAGFTFGLSSSFFDFYSAPATSYYGGKINPSQDTGDGGTQVWAYTAQFGNGLSGTIAAEGNRNTTVWNTALTNSASTGQPGSSVEGFQYPDIVANLRIEQPWGAAQIMGAIHNASGQYYGSTTTSGHPGDVTGWAAGFGLKLFAPMISKGDYFQAEVNYAEGASAYITAGGVARYAYFDGNGPGSYGTGIITDSVYGGSGDVELTTAWGVNAAYEHIWNPHWRTSLYGYYQAFSYNDNANALICGKQAAWVTSVTAGTCDSDFNLWGIGTRTQWNVTSDFHMGLDVVYVNLDTASKGLTGNVTGSGTQPTAVRSFDDQHGVVVYFRVHKDFYP